MATEFGAGVFDPPATTGAAAEHTQSAQTTQTDLPATPAKTSPLDDFRDALQKAQAAQPAATPETPAQPAVSPGLADRVKALGFADVKDDAEAMDRLLQAYEQERLAKAQYEEQLRLAAELERQKTAPATQPAADPGAAAKPTDWWSPPQVDMDLIESFKTDTGWKPETPPQVRVQAEQYEKYIRGWTDKLVRNPIEALKPMFEAAKKEWMAEVVQSLQTEQQTQQQLHEQQAFVQGAIAENAAWLFEKDPLTNKPKEGTPSIEGRQFMEFLAQAEQFGIADPKAQWKYAMDQRELARLKAGLTQQQQSEQAAQVAQQKKNELLQRAIPNAPRNGATPPVGEPGHGQPQARQESPGRQFLAEARAAGLFVGRA